MQKGKVVMSKSIMHMHTHLTHHHRINSAGTTYRKTNGSESVSDWKFYLTYISRIISNINFFQEHLVLLLFSLCPLAMLCHAHTSKHPCTHVQLFSILINVEYFLVWSSVKAFEFLYRPKDRLSTWGVVLFLQLWQSKCHWLNVWIPGERNLAGFCFLRMLDWSQRSTGAEWCLVFECLPVDVPWFVIKLERNPQYVGQWANTGTRVLVEGGDILTTRTRTAASSNPVSQGWPNLPTPVITTTLEHPHTILPWFKQIWLK